MAKLSISLAIASLTVSLTPAANDYEAGQENGATYVSLVDQVNVLFGAATSQHGGSCEIDTTPVLASALGISTAPSNDSNVIALASCEPE